jgi:hypothetical protein
LFPPTPGTEGTSLLLDPYAFLEGDIREVKMRERMLLTKDDPYTLVWAKKLGMVDMQAVAIARLISTHL